MFVLIGAIVALAMASAPIGTATLLFTDIAGSTRLLRALGRDKYGHALRDHRRLLREIWATQDGYEVDTEGDAFFVAFPRASLALEAAAEAQRALTRASWPDGAEIRVRIGVHSGEASVQDNMYVGVAVHRAARICGAAHGGQVLVSQTTAELCADEPPSGLTLRDLGLHRLKDLTEPQRLYQLVGDGLGRDFPPPRTLENLRTNLPVQPTPFIGRERELRAIETLVCGPDVRLLTLTGTGGTGKTRLALQAAADLVHAFANGVFFISLAPLVDPDLVVPSVAQTLGVREAAGEALRHSLSGYLREREMLLVLDNFEQLLDAGPEVAALLQEAPKLKLLVTSRERLRLAAEHEYAVLPFVEQEGVVFFRVRARAVRPDFQPGGHVLEICRRLDHLPLALELAAARVRALSTKQILERLERSLPLLTGGARDAPDRQQTLRATIAWSYDLLTAEEQRVFRQLAVFSGGCTLVATEEIAEANLDAMQLLVEKSLVRFDGERYSVLETIREFALERLEEAGESEDARRRHLDFFFRLAEAANTSAETGYGRRYDVLLPEQGNFRAAIDTAVALGDFPLATELMVMLEQFWVIADPFEGARRFETLLNAGQLPDLLRARALRCYAGSLFIAGDFEQSHRMTEESLALFRALGDERGVAGLLIRLGISTLELGDTQKARELLEESRRLFKQLGIDNEEAEVIGALGYVEQEEGKLEKAAELFRRSAELAAATGFTWSRVYMLRALVECLVELGRIDEGEAGAREELALAKEIGDRQSMIYGLAQLAWLASVGGNRVRAGRLWGAIEAEEARAPVGQWADEREFYCERVLGADGPGLEPSLEIGRRVSFEKAVDEALS